jgi:hypothetical protein
MAESRLAKFLADQQEAVAIAVEQTGEPSPYGVRCDAINAALGLANATTEATTVAELLQNARLIEKYLKGD